MASVDAIARAYATIGVRPGASARELKRQYKKLVRQWHPDRYANDPAGQAEATVRMRLINDAYATLEQIAPRERNSTGAPTQSLSREELDALVNAIGTQSPVLGTVRLVIGMLPIGLAFLLVQPQRSPKLLLTWPSAENVIVAGILFAFGVSVLISWRLRR